MNIIVYLYLYLLTPIFINSFNTFGNINNLIDKGIRIKKNIDMNNDDNKYFLQLLNYNLDLTNKLELTPVKIESTFEKINTTKNNGYLYNYCYTSEKIRKMRFTYFDCKSKYQYFGLVIHPSYNYDIPIFNFEVILYNNEKIVCTLNMVKMDNSKKYNKKYVHPFMKIKSKYPELKENMAVKLSGYNIFGNYISEAILLGKFVHKNANKDVNDEIYMKEKIYNDIIIQSFIDYMTCYIDFFDNPNLINKLDELENIKDRHKLFDMKKAFVETKYDIRKCFDETLYKSMLYNFFYKLENEYE